MMVVLLILLFLLAMFEGLFIEFYKKIIRKNKSSEIENKLMAILTALAFAVVFYFCINPEVLPNELVYTPWLVLAITVIIYIMQLPACMQIFKPLIKKIIERKLND